MSNRKKIFLTGVTGYIGGDVLYALNAKSLLNKHDVSVLVRNKDKAIKVTEACPQVQVILGDLGDANLLREQAAQADIVVHCASLDDLAASEAIAQGLKDRQRPGVAFWVAISGTDNLAWRTIKYNTYGEANELEGEYYKDDNEGIEELFSTLPADAPHHNVERAQVAANSDRVKVAIVAGPCIYGVGRGPGNQRSIQIPDLIAYTLKNETAFKIGRGLSRWPFVHIHDFSDLFVRLAEDAVNGGGPDAWGPISGYYFAMTETLDWAKVALMVTIHAHRQGFILESHKVDSMTAEEADAKVNQFASLFYGTDSHCAGIRAGSVFGWNPSGHSVRDEIANAVAEEAKALKIQPKYR